VARTFYLESYGCQQNVHDAERMAGLLEAAGFEAVDDPTLADIVVINTCSVRERAEDKLFHRLDEIRYGIGRGPKPVIAVTGCVAQQEGRKLLERAPDISVIVGTQAMRRLPVLVEHAFTSDDPEPRIDLNPQDDASFPLGIARRGDPVKAYVTIIEGCNDFCASAWCHTPAATSGCARSADPATCTRPWPGRRKTADRADRESLPGPGRPRCDFANCLRASTGSRASSASGSPARIRGT
jgi:tRNA-2-methylthio-N6-dimethylallyladenosine synthase